MKFNFRSPSVILKEEEYGFNGRIKVESSQIVGGKSMVSGVPAIIIPPQGLKILACGYDELALNTLALSEDTGETWTGLGNSVYPDECDIVVKAGNIIYTTGFDSNWDTFSYYSTDNAVSWNLLMADLWVNSVAHNGSIYVMGADYYTHSMLYSYDGINWTGLGATSFYEDCRYVVWDGEKFFAGGASTIAIPNILSYSSDGINWTDLGLRSIMTTVNGIAFNDDKTMYVCVGGGSSSTNNLMYSPDGINWTGAGKAMFNFSGNAVVYHNGMFYAIGSSFTSTGATSATSSDGINWNILPNTLGTSTLNSLKVKDNKFYAQFNDTINVSEDFINWTPLSFTLFQLIDYDFI